MLVAVVAWMRCSRPSDPLATMRVPSMRVTRPSAKLGSTSPGSTSGATVAPKAASGASEPSAVAPTRPATPSTALVSTLRRSMSGVIVAPQLVLTVQGRRPLDRSAMALNADAVRSITRLVPQLDPQQFRSPQNRCVLGPQSAIEVLTLLPLQGLVVKCTKPQPRCARPRPHRSGLVMFRQAAEVFG